MKMLDTLKLIFSFPRKQTHTEEELELIECLKSAQKAGIEVFVHENGGVTRSMWTTNPNFLLTLDKAAKLVERG